MDTRTDDKAAVGSQRNRGDTDSLLAGRTHSIISPMKNASKNITTSASKNSASSSVNYSVNHSVNSAKTAVNFPKLETTLADSFGRRFSYLRLSVTDACNFKCQYCLPNGYQPPARSSGHELGDNGRDMGTRELAHEGFLNLDEIRLLMLGFAEVGTKKIRITGGEPTLRRDILEIARAAATTPGIEKVALSTNGWNLSKLAQPLRAAGVSAVNVSADSLDRARFAETSGVDRAEDVIRGIDAALSADFKAVKINAVLMRQNFEDELKRFLDFVRTRPVSVRFIELMATLENRKLFEAQHLRSEFLRDRLVQSGWSPRTRGRDDGPAVEYVHSEYKGSIGVIAPYGNDFCSNCNRLRVTSRGAVRLCLFGDGNHSIRHLLQQEQDRSRLHAELWKLVGVKKVSHELQAGQLGDNRGFSAMGG